MSEAPIVQTRRNLPRTDLDKFFHQNPRMRKAFEDLLLDVGVTLPEAIGSNSADAGSVIAQTMFSREPALLPPAADGLAPMLAAAAFIRPPPPAQPVNDAAGLILAGQIFGA